MEQWTQIGDTHYSVSTEGRVRNDKTGELKALTERRDGYFKVDLYTDGKRLSKRVNRLVAEGFIPNPNNKPQVNHIDGNKHNNNVENLEWVNNSENMLHAYKTGLALPHVSYSMRGHRNPNAGAKGRPIICTETNAYYKNVAEAERLTGIPDSCICDCLKGHCSHAHGFHFEYA